VAGRLIDPLSGFDAMADVAVGAGRIAAVGAAIAGALLCRRTSLQRSSVEGAPWWRAQGGRILVLHGKP
jgi:hypothetical protein